MSFPTVYYITQVIPPCYTAGYAMCVCVSFGACVYRSLDSAGSGVSSVHVVLSVLRSRSLSFVHLSTSCRQGCMLAFAMFMSV